MTTPTRAVGYVRVSSPAGLEESLSPETQRRSIAEYCTRQGWTLTRVYEDLGYSGWREATWENRPGWLQMIADAQRSQFDAVVVFALDRFARRTEGVTYRALLKRAGVRVVSVTEPLDDSEMGDWMMDVIGANAQFFSAVHSARTRGVRRSRAEHGLHNCNRVPFGYAREGRELVPHPHDADGVRLAYALAAAGDISTRDIAARLNQAGYHSTLGNPMTKDLVRRLLRNPVYIGFTRYHERLIQGRHPQLVDAVTWQRVQDILKARYRVPGCEARPAVIYPLTGLLHCECGARMHGSTVRRKGDRERCYYYCRSDGRYLPAEPLEAAVFSILQGIALPDDWRDQLAQYYAGTKTTRELEQERAKLAARTERLAQVYVDGVIARDDYDRERAAIEAAATRLSSAQLARTQDIGDAVLSFDRAWEHATPAERKTLCRLLLSRIELDGSQVARVYPCPDFEALLKATGSPLLVTGGFMTLITPVRASM